MDWFAYPAIVVVLNYVSLVLPPRSRQTATKRTFCLSEWIDLVKSGIEKNVAAPSEYGESLRSKPGEGTYFNDYCNWTRIDEFREFVAKSPAAAIAGQLMTSRIRFASAQCETVSVCVPTVS